MVVNCDCLGCKNIAKHQPPRNAYKNPCVPTYPHNRNFDRENNVNGINVNCIPKPNVNQNYERDVKTSDLYRTKNIPERFERSSKFQHNILVE